MKLFDSEWKVMEVLWQDGDTTAKGLSLRAGGFPRGDCRVAALLQTCVISPKAPRSARHWSPHPCGFGLRSTRA